MKPLTLTALLLLAYPTETQSRQISYVEAVKMAYEMGKQERLMLNRMKALRY